MPNLIHRDVQAAEPWNLRVFLRELNTRLRGVAQVVTNNRTSSFPAVSFTTSTNATQVVWIAKEVFEIESLDVVGTTTAGTVDVEIGGVAVGGGTFAVTTSVVNHPVTSPRETAESSPVAIVTSGLTGQACVTLNLRRIN